MTITAQEINRLRSKTGCGLMDCKQALEDAGGDLEKAIEFLRKKGERIAAKKADRETGQGVIEAYIHAGAKVGALVRIVCETDFVARNEIFKELAHNIAMQITAMSPKYVRREDVPANELEKEKDVYRAQCSEEGKPAEIIEKIIAGRMDKFYSEVCLEEQPYIKDDKKTIKDLIQEAVAKLGENIKVAEFSRFAIQGSSVSCLK